MSQSLINYYEGEKDSEWVLIKPSDSKFEKRASAIRWIEWDKKGDVKNDHTKPKEGYSLLMGPFSKHFTWVTEPVSMLNLSLDNIITFNIGEEEYKLYKAKFQ